MFKLVTAVALALSVAVPLLAQEHSQKSRELTAKTVLDSLTSKYQIKKYGVRDETLLLAAPVSPNFLSLPLERALYHICNKKLLVYDLQAPESLQILPTPLGDSVLAGNFAVFFLVDEDGKPLPQIEVKISKELFTRQTSEDGMLVLPGLHEGDEIFVRATVNSHKATIIYRGQPVTIVQLQPKVKALKEFTTKPTGFLDISAKQQTGAFSVVDMRLFSHDVGFDVFERLQQSTPHLAQDDAVLNTGTANATYISNAIPVFDRKGMLFVVDGEICPYPELINPSTIQSILVAKDAATMALYGSRGANGIVLIKLKKVDDNDLNIEYEYDYTDGNVDLQYPPVISSADFVELEKDLYGKGVYDERKAKNLALSNAVEVLIAHTEHRITLDERDSLLLLLGNRDVRKDQLLYFFQPAYTSQHTINIQQSLKKLKSYFSVGHAKKALPLAGNDFERNSIYLNNAYSNKNLSLNFRIRWTEVKGKVSNAQLPSALPYLELSHPIPFKYRMGYIDTLAGGQYFSQLLKPSQEKELINHTYNRAYFTFTPKIIYQPFKWLQLTAFYKYGKYDYTEERLSDRESYMVRSTMNELASVENGIVKWPIPYGAIYDHAEIKALSNDGRIQFEYNPAWLRDHLSLLVGTEAQYTKMQMASYRVYGQDAPASLMAPGKAVVDSIDFFRGIYMNIIYSINNTFTMSGSLRYDQSNRYGLKRWLSRNPFYSVGTSLHLYKLKGYPKKFPFVTLRATFGESGNDNPQINAMTTIKDGDLNRYHELVAVIDNTANTLLASEKLKTINIGIDISSKDSIISASVDVYNKSTNTLLGRQVVNPTSGVNFINSNNGGLKGIGIDFSASLQFKVYDIKNYTNFWISYGKNKITSDLPALDKAWKYAIPAYYSSRKNHPLYAIYAFELAPLDSLTGDPVGLLNGEKSKNYTDITESNNPNAIKYIGPLLPVWFGSFTHSFSYHGLTLNAQLGFKLGHFFRRGSYSSIGIIDGTNAHGDFYNRWQTPGDEKKTNIPSFDLTGNIRREAIFQYGEDLVLPADHIRFNYVRLGYRLEVSTGQRFLFRSMEINMGLRNLAIVWKKNSMGLDPEVPINGYPIRKQMTLQILAQF